MTHCNRTKNKVSLSNLVTYINNVVVVLLFLFLSLFDSIKEGIIFRINNTSKYIGGVGTVTVRYTPDARGYHEDTMCPLWPLRCTAVRA